MPCVYWISTAQPLAAALMQGEPPSACPMLYCGTPLSQHALPCMAYFCMDVSQQQQGKVHQGLHDCQMLILPLLRHCCCCGCYSKGHAWLMLARMRRRRRTAAKPLGPVTDEPGANPRVIPLDRPTLAAAFMGPTAALLVSNASFLPSRCLYHSLLYQMSSFFCEACNVYGNQYFSHQQAHLTCPLDNFSPAVV